MADFNAFIQDDILHVTGDGTATISNGVLNVTGDGVTAEVRNEVLRVYESSQSSPAAAIKAAVETYGRRIDLSITHGSTVYSSEKIVSCDLSFSGKILESVMRQAEIELDDVGGQDFAEGMVGERIQITLTIDGNGVVQKDFGTFIVRETAYNDDTKSVTLTCYDLMLLSMVPYTPVIEFPVTLGAYMAAICSYMGLTLNTPEFTNSTVEIEEEKYDNQYTFRDVLTEIAQAAGGTVAIKNDALYVLYPEDSGMSVEPSILKTSKVGEKYGPVNSVVIARTPQEDNIYKRDENLTSWVEIKIANNQLMDTHREDFIDGLYERLYGLEFYPYEITSFGIVYLDVCDVFTLHTLDGQQYSTLYMGADLQINQGMTEDAKLEALPATATEYEAASKTDRVINKTILRVDKQEQIIEGLVTTTTNKLNDINGQLETLTRSVSTKITPEQVSIEITKAISGIDSITTSTGYTFDMDGLHIQKAGEEMENLLDNTGMYVNRDNDNILTANNEGVSAINLEARQYLIIGANSRFEDYEGNRTALFYIGG